MNRKPNRADFLEEACILQGVALPIKLKIVLSTRWLEIPDESLWLAITS